MSSNEFEDISALLKGPEGERIDQLASIVTNIVNIFVKAINTMEQRITALEKRIDEMSGEISALRTGGAAAAPKPGAPAKPEPKSGIVKASLVSPSALKAHSQAPPSRPPPPGGSRVPPPRSGNIIFELKELFRRAKGGG